jgi:hypothetical protein
MLAVEEPRAVSQRPPAWLIAATAALACATLVMAVAETTLWKHYLIDQGEYFSLGGLAFIAVAGVYLHRTGRLLASLPLVFPWLLFPVITQGDQLIDNLSINWMRFICHVLLAALFGTPVAVIVVATRYAFAPGRARARTGEALLAAALLTLEVWVAHHFLGTLMVLTLIGMILGTLAYAWRTTSERPSPAGARLGQRFALVVLIGGVVVSLGLYLGYKNRPGAYQGSPAYYMDPAQKDSAYPLDRISVPAKAAALPPREAAEAATRALTGYARALQQVLDGYYIADRNYNYAFHNALFLRHTPVLPGFRRVALDTIAAARPAAEAADRSAAVARAALADDDALAALLDEMREYVAFTFRRAALLERLTADFERTQAGLQHATHIYEGEGKVLGVRLMDILEKHRATLDAAALAPVTTEFRAASGAVHDRYANRIVGF